MLTKLNSHLSPVYPSLQVQLNPQGPSIQTPPLVHCTSTPHCSGGKLHLLDTKKGKKSTFLDYVTLYCVIRYNCVMLPLLVIVSIATIMFDIMIFFYITS